MTIIACRANLVAEISGLKAHRMLVPANARYTSRQITLGGRVRRERFCRIKMTEIAARAGQKILFSGRASIAACSVKIG